MNSKKISIIIPAYNEERRIGKTLEAYSEFFRKLEKAGKLNYEILIIINNTTDRTEDVVKKIQKKDSKIRYLNLVEGGKGFAVIEGFKDALKRDNDLIGFVDADMATRPDAFYDLVKYIGERDGAVASRYVKGATINPKPTMQRLIAKKMFNTLVRSVLFLPHRDTQCGAKLFKRTALERVIPKLSMSQWAFDVELLYHMRKEGYKIREIPTRWSDMKYGKINFWQAGPSMVLGVIRLRIINSPLKRTVRIYESIASVFMKKFKYKEFSRE